VDDDREKEGERSVVVGSGVSVVLTSCKEETIVIHGLSTFSSFGESNTRESEGTVPCLGEELSRNADPLSCVVELENALQVPSSFFSLTQSEERGGAGSSFSLFKLESKKRFCSWRWYDRKNPWISGERWPRVHRLRSSSSVVSSKGCKGPSFLREEREFESGRASSFSTLSCCPFDELKRSVVVHSVELLPFVALE